MSAIYGRVGHSKATGFQNLFETEYKKKCQIDSYSYCEENEDLSVSFGQCLQYLTAESHKEIMPNNSDDSIFTADLILDNREYVVEKIKETFSDVSKELLLTEADGSLMNKLLKAQGTNSAKDFLGAYSFAFYDKKRKRLTLAADPVSSRCLYYYYDKEQVVFSTILAPLVKWCPEISISREYLMDFLAAPGLMPSVQSDLSPYSGIYMVNAGSLVHFDFTASDIKKSEEFYIDWKTGRGIKDGAIGEFTTRKKVEDYLTDFRHLYRECVASACRCEKNVAISLSSGFDSASVGSLAAQTLMDQGKSLFTFTYVPYEKPAEDHNKNNIHDETAPVKELSTLYPNMVQEFVNNGGRNCVEQLQSITNILELPIKAVANMPSLFEVFRLARDKDCRIVLTGQTGNASVSCGYIDNILFDLYLHHKYIKLISYLFSFSKDVGESRRRALRGVLSMCRYEKKQLKNKSVSQAYYPSRSGELYPWINSEEFRDYNFAAQFNKSGSHFNLATLNCREAEQEFMTSRACHSYLGAYETKAGLSNGVVLRDPTRDPRIIWFCYNLPYHLYAYKGKTRWLIREGLKDMLPVCITKNQIRYGVQNSDCGRRLLRDIKEVNQLIDSITSRFKASSPEDIKALILPEKLPRLTEAYGSELPQADEVELLTALGCLSFINNEI